MKPILWMSQGLLGLMAVVALAAAPGRSLPKLAPSRARPESYWPTRGWRSSAPEAEGMDSEALARAFDYVREHRIPIHSVLIVRNGSVVLDAYFYPFHEGLVHDTASMTKSITSTLIGIAVGEHMISSVRQPVLSFFPTRTVGNRDERKGRMTVEHLLTMTSGLDCHFDQAEMTLRQMLQSPDPVRFMLDLPMAAEPGGTFVYCSGGMHLLSGVLSQITGGSAFEFARRALFRPVGIEDPVWPADPQGISHGWGDLHLRLWDCDRSVLLFRDVKMPSWTWNSQTAVWNGGRWVSTERRVSPPTAGSDCQWPLRAVGRATGPLSLLMMRWPTSTVTASDWHFLGTWSISN